MTKEDLAAAVRSTACTLVRKHGIPPGIACKMAARAVLRARGLPIPAGLGATTPPPPSGAPDVLAQINAAGDDPTVAAARGAVSKWSWLIPVGGLLMSFKRKVSEWRTPTTAAIVGAGRRR